MAEQRLIDANEAIEIAKKCYPAFGISLADLTDLREVLEDCTIVDAKPVVHAHWISEDEAEELGHLEWSYSCSNCKEIFWDYTESFAFSYCPHCGAQMDESISCSHEDDMKGE